jgi:hypothetical protein
MITDLDYISYDEAIANPKHRRKHLDQCLYFVAESERTLNIRKQEYARAEKLVDGLEENK